MSRFFDDFCLIVLLNRDRILDQMSTNSHKKIQDSDKQTVLQIFRNEYDMPKKGNHSARKKVFDN